jgi:acetyl esterase/lipase
MKIRRLVGLIGLMLLVAPRFALAADPGVEVLRSRTYVKRDTGPLEADVYMPAGKGPFPGMLVVHGGAWRIGTRSQLAGAAAALAAHGYTAVAISYRLAPSSTFPAQIYDCQAAVRWMRTHASEFKIDPQLIGGFGYSAGGHLVALLGVLDDDDFKEEGVPADAPSARLQCVLAGGAPCDFRDLPARSTRLAYWLGGTPAVKPDNYRNASPANFITADDPPMFFFHGVDDMLVPVSSPEKMVGSLKSAGLTAEIYAVKDSGHLHTMFDRGALEHALDYADRYLKAEETKTAASGGDDAAHADVSTDKAANSLRKGESSDGQ